MGLPAENVTLTDKVGVVHAGREAMAANRTRYARQTDAHSREGFRLAAIFG
jgi:malate dehydrogenase (oxaloacetate-decarboxylating)(NADP+)